MENITLNTELDDKNINIVFSTGETIKIATTGDIDLSKFVKKLTVLINKEVELSFSKFENDDPKINLIQETIANIINSFNHSFDVETEEIKDDIPF